jgi:hypothetical protein
MSMHSCHTCDGLTVTQEFARAFLEARNKVPTRPHPWAPQSGGVAQKLAGMQATVHDKVVEKLGGREFVELKFHHAEP